MVAFTGLVTISLLFVPVSRSVVLAYTTPIWVAIGACIFLGEALTLTRVLGVISSLAGLLLLVYPEAFALADRNFVIGNFMMLIVVLCWSASMLHIRGHNGYRRRLICFPGRLPLPRASCSFSRFFFEEFPLGFWKPRVIGLLLYGAVIGVVFSYWATATVNKKRSGRNNLAWIVGRAVGRRWRVHCRVRRTDKSDVYCGRCFNYRRAGD